MSGSIRDRAATPFFSVSCRRLCCSLVTFAWTGASAAVFEAPPRSSSRRCPSSLQPIGVRLAHPHPGTAVAARVGRACWLRWAVFVAEELATGRALMKMHGLMPLSLAPSTWHHNNAMPGRGDMSFVYRRGGQGVLVIAHVIFVDR